MVTQAIMYIVFLLLLAALAGWPAARLIKGHGLGLWGNGVGVAGAPLCGVPLGQFGVRLLGPVGQSVTAALGAIILLSMAGLIERK